VALQWAGNLRKAIVGVSAIAMCACGDQGPRSTGAARVTVATAGLDVDPDGYGVRLDAGSPQNLSINGTLIFTGLSVGAHTVTLDGIASNCMMDQANPLSVDVLASDTADVFVAVRCTITYAAVSLGYLYACGVTIRGAAYCWGYDAYGQLGDAGSGACNACPSPVPVAGGLRFAVVNAGDRHACGLTTDGAAYCWGDNTLGKLGDGTTTSRASPEAVLGRLPLATLSTGGDHACGLLSDGSAYCWGGNYAGQLGDGTTTSRTSPIPVVGALPLVHVSAGLEHTCGIAAGGAAYCWGSNFFGTLGDGTTTDRSSPVLVLGGLTFIQISAGSGHTCGLTAGGTAYCWGRNDFGELGDGTVTHRSSPVAVLGGLSFTALYAGGGTTCGITAGGAAYCWGWNSLGQLGDGTQADHSTPVAVLGGLSFATVSVGDGGYHACGVTTAGVAYCWGDNSQGELGYGSFHIGSGYPEPPTYSTVPVKVVGQP